jgi:hypothetical protein
MEYITVPMKKDTTAMTSGAEVSETFKSLVALGGGGPKAISTNLTVFDAVNIAS